VAKLADAPDLGSGGEILRGSSPLPGTMSPNPLYLRGIFESFRRKVDYQIPSDEAIRNAFSTPERQRYCQARVGLDSQVTSCLQRHCNGVASLVQAPLNKPHAAKLATA
jgi:hypothetical protein